MKLHTLHASYDSGITDEGIKNMNLHKLCASDNRGITDEGIKNMNLHTLEVSGIVFPEVFGRLIFGKNQSINIRFKESDVDTSKTSEKTSRAFLKIFGRVQISAERLYLYDDFIISPHH